jgi:hypothetical protein
VYLLDDHVGDPLDLDVELRGNKVATEATVLDVNPPIGVTPNLLV